MPFLPPNQQCQSTEGIQSTEGLAILPCDLSLITMYISDWRQFSDIHTSQGSVATYLRCGGIFKYEFVADLPLSLSVKEL